MAKSETHIEQSEQVGINVITTYLPNHSNPDDSHYTFAYTITITNHGANTVQLLSRHWIITDANEQVQEVRGEGVVGEQPVLAPGEYFRYTSGTNMATKVGFMEGSYSMIVIENGSEGKRFEVPIPAFSLHLPNAMH